MDHIYFPKNWIDRWPEFAKAILSYLREGKNLNDDGPDTLTGVAEKINSRNKITAINKNTLGIR